MKRQTQCNCAEMLNSMNHYHPPAINDPQARHDCAYVALRNRHVAQADKLAELATETAFPQPPKPPKQTAINTVKETEAQVRHALWELQSGELYNRLFSAEMIRLSQPETRNQNTA